MVSDRSNGVNWRIILAITGLIVGIALGATGASLYYAEKQQQKAVTANAHTKNQGKIPEPYLTPRSGMPATIEGAISNPQPTTGQDHEKRDLAAQEASATFAWWMVVVSLFSALITAFGTVLLYQQIILTREAVQDTGLATKAMNKQNAIAEAQLRPMLHIENMGWQRPEYSQNAIFILELKNFGQTPARNCQVSADVRYSVNKAHPKGWRLRILAVSDIVPQGKIVTVVVEIGDTRHENKDTALIKENTYCRFEIRYTDAFGNSFAHFETHMQLSGLPINQPSDTKFRFLSSP
jgi:hypothetical protein